MPFVSMPNLGESLGFTRDQIRNNILDIKNSLAVNHVDLDNGADTGKHTMTNFLQISAAAQKPTTGATEVALYNDVAKTGQIWLCPPNTTQGDKKVQLTAGDVTNAKFATNTNYATPTNMSLSGGWTFLPGGLLLQYGKINTTSTISVSPVQVDFPIAFGGVPYSVTASLQSQNNNYILVIIDSNPPTATGFRWASNNGLNPSSNAIYWTAIGPA